MASTTSIEWTATVNADGTVTPGSSWNPTRGCSRVSPGCGGPGKQGGCYAEIMAARFSKPGQWGHGFAEMVGSARTRDHRWTGKVELIESQLLLPLKWRKPRRIFVNSTSDLFHEALSDEDIDRVFAVMAIASQHTYQILTKRSARMLAYLSRDIEDRIDDICHTLDGSFDETWHYPANWPLPNVWLGVSVEDQDRADERIPDLLATPAAVRFLSVEPMLGPVDIVRWTQISWQCSSCRAFFAGRHKPSCPDCGSLGGLTGSHAFNGRRHKQSDVGSGVDMVIAGAESGPNARPMELEWARALKDQCAAAGVAFFMKQTSGQGGRAIKDMDLFPADLRVREFPQ